MNALEFLQSRGRPAPSHRVAIRLCGKDRNGNEVMADAEAVMVLVSDDARLRCTEEAAAALAKAGKAPTDERLRTEETYHVLCRALRDADQSSKPFFETVLQAQSLLVAVEAVRIMREYQGFVDEHYPEVISVDEMQAMEDDARALFFGDLISKYGYWPIRRALPSLAATLGESRAARSSDTGPA